VLKNMKRRLSNRKPVVKRQGPTPSKRKYVSTDVSKVESKKEEDVGDLVEGDGDDSGADNVSGIGYCL
jgi:hypothetical protein